MRNLRACGKLGDGYLSPSSEVSQAGAQCGVGRVKRSNIDGIQPPDELQAVTVYALERTPTVFNEQPRAYARGIQRGELRSSAFGGYSPSLELTLGVSRRKNKIICLCT